MFNRHKFVQYFGVALLLLLAALPLQAQNGVLLQAFHWYIDPSTNLWVELENNADDLAAAGFTALWIPPATKGNSATDVGYSVYDLYDLGEFNQKGTTRTKYGYKSELQAAINAAHTNGMQVYFDVVLNHRIGADTTENVQSVRVQTYDRNIEYGSDVWIDAWTKFDFPGRGNTYSSFKWRWYHFDGVDWAQNLQETGKIYKFRGTGKAWDWEVDTENGNYDYLLGADVDMSHPDVRTELKNWGVWVSNNTGIDGFRLDAVKHIQFSFWNEWLDYVRTTTGKPLFTVGELWSYDASKLNNWITKTGGRASLFDAPLHLNFANAGNGGGGYDMRNILNNTLMSQQPTKAVTLVENHDTQPLQALESPVASWFKPIAYAIILLREEGYPTVFYADYYGASYTDRGGDGNLHNITIPSQKVILDKLLAARRDYAYGQQRVYFDHVDVVGWTRAGDTAHPQSLAVLVTDGPAGSKWMETGKVNTTYYDFTGNRSDLVTTNGSGWGEFKVNGGSVSVWVPQSSATASVHFTCQNGTTYWGQNVYVVGNQPQLGSWNTANAVLLSSANYPTWDGTVSGLPANTAVEWKCIKKDGSNNVVWQGGANNTVTTPSSGSVNSTGSF